MNSDTLIGTGRDMAGTVKESVGAATGDRALETEGKADHFGAQVQKGYGAAKDAVLNGSGPLVEKARGFAKDRPFAAAALVGVVGLAILNTLRGKR